MSPLYFIALVSSILLTLVSCQNEQKKPVAHAGRLDLTSWAIAVDGSVELTGDWNFYWSQLLTPADFSRISPPEATGLIHVPGDWKRLRIGRERLGPFGAATYHLTVLLPPGQQALSLELDRIFSAYRLWVNGEEIAGRGKVGLSADSTSMELHHDLIPLPSTKGELDLVLQVANFDLKRFGVVKAIRIAPHALLQAQLYRDQAYDFFVAGGLLLLGLFFLSRYFVGRVILEQDDDAALWFPVVCLLWGTHGLFVGISGFPLQNLWSLDWTLYFRLDFLIVIFSIPALTLLFSALYPRESFGGFDRLWLVPAVLFSLFALFTQPATFSRALEIYKFLGLFQMLYVVWILVRAWWRGREGTNPILAGVLVLNATSINDALHFQGLIHTFYLLPLGVLTLVMTQAYSLSLRSVRARRKVEQLSHELEEKNLALEQNVRLKEEFLSNTSHELRTPLNGIIGLAESLRDEAGKTEEYRIRDLNLIAASGRRLANLINDILDFSRLRNRDLELDLNPVELKGLVEVVISFCTPLFVGKPLKLVNNIPDDLPPVRADENRLQQIFYNLVGNAIKFTDSGLVSINAELAGEWVTIGVKDTGPGIPYDQQKTIFRPFEQGDGGVSREHGGTGLGLGISRHLVDLHGSRLELVSTPGEGALFFFRLPVCALDETDHCSKASGDREHFPAFIPALTHQVAEEDDGNPLVLLVDDDPVNLQVAVNHLRSDRVTVTPVTSGREALALLDRGVHFDLVLLDIMMPDINGLEVCRRLRHQYSSAELPVIMVTARNRLTDLVEGLSFGANDYLIKPFAREELLARTRAQLQVRKAHQALEENRQLKEALAQREEMLQRNNARLADILDGLTQAVLVINSSGEIIFGNKILSGMSGFQNESLTGQPISLLFMEETSSHLLNIIDRSIDPDTSTGDPRQPDDQTDSTLLLTDQTMRTRQHGDIRVSLQATCLEFEDEYLFFLYVLPEVSGADHLPNPTSLFPQPADSSVEKEAQPDLRQLLVEIMNLALDIWVRETASTKVELAKRSGLWSVYSDRDGWERTQTLDRYLQQATIPKRPRRRVVIDTAEFVLRECSGPKDGVDQLRYLLTHLPLV